MRVQQPAAEAGHDTLNSCSVGSTLSLFFSLSPALCCCYELTRKEEKKKKKREEREVGTWRRNGVVDNRLGLKTKKVSRGLFSLSSFIGAPPLTSFVVTTLSSQR